MAGVDVIAGRFEIEREAGTGGMGVVYRAHDRLTGMKAAVKVLAPQTGYSIERFAREARLLAELCHPAIVTYLAHGVVPPDKMYIAMEWLEGVDLAERLRHGPLSAHESVTLVRCAAEGLASAHQRGIVHRDIKPANLFLVGGSPSGVKLVDFGVAHISSESARLTRCGEGRGGTVKHATS